MDSNFQFRARRAGVLKGLYRRRPSKVFAFPPKRPVSWTRDRMVRIRLPPAASLLRTAGEGARPPLVCLNEGYWGPGTRDRTEPWLNRSCGSGLRPKGLSEPVGPGGTVGTSLPSHVGRFAASLIKPRPLIDINASDWDGTVWWTSARGRAVSYPSASSELRLPPGIRNVDEMDSWLVPPIVIPVLIAIMVVVYGLYRAYS
jgi:hypothetical protein